MALGPVLLLVARALGVVVVALALALAPLVVSTVVLPSPSPVVAVVAAVVPPVPAGVAVVAVGAELGKAASLAARAKVCQVALLEAGTVELGHLLLGALALAVARVGDHPDDLLLLLHGQHSRLVLSRLSVAAESPS